MEAEVALLWYHPFDFGQIVLIYIKFLRFFFSSLLKAEMCFLTGPANALSGLSKAIYTARESFRLSLGLQE